MKLRPLICALAACAVIYGCGGNEKPVVKTTAPKREPLMAPFKFHKLLEVSPGNYYDVVSWGRGAGNENEYMILRSDSTGKQFNTISEDLDGAIVDVYNSDMDLDGNPEILIQAKGKDSINFTHIYAYEFNNGRAQKLDFPKLKSSKKNYRGNDNFYIKEGKLIREFPSYTSNDKDAKLTGGKFRFEYGLQDNSLTASLLEEDSTQVDKPEPAAATPVVNRGSSEKPKVRSSSSKRKATTTKKKRKHRR